MLAGDSGQSAGGNGVGTTSGVSPPPPAGGGSDCARATLGAKIPAPGKSSEKMRTMELTTLTDDGRTFIVDSFWSDVGEGGLRMTYEVSMGSNAVASQTWQRLVATR